MNDTEFMAILANASLNWTLLKKDWLGIYEYMSVEDMISFIIGL